uniref:Uncharacterized protein LOC114336044 n=1 Tax=Diabrotica virgifera virgifera TaxID=50390 RepID=A0A6P7FZV1_DIAVI
MRRQEEEQKEERRRQEEEQKEERRRQAEIDTMNSLSQIHENFQVRVTNIESEQTALPSFIVDPDTIRSSKILKPPTFDGQITWETYCFQFEAAARANGWNENKMAAFLVVSLRGQAATVLQFLPQGAPSYTSLVQALEARYSQQHLKQVFQS